MYTKYVYTNRDEGFDEKSFSTNLKELLSLTEISAKV